MRFLNQVTLYGMIVSDVDIKTFQNNRRLVKFRLLTKIFWKKADGEWGDKPAWHTVQAWGKTADRIAKLSLRKNHMALVTGTLQYDTWEDKNGIKRTTALVEVSDLVPFMEKPEILPVKGGPERDEAPDEYPPEQNDTDSELTGDDDDLPFF